MLYEFAYFYTYNNCVSIAFDAGFETIPERRVGCRALVPLSSLMASRGSDEQLATVELVGGHFAHATTRNVAKRQEQFVFGGSASGHCSLLKINCPRNLLDWDSFRFGVLDCHRGI
jgi:hypothetical protein